MINVDETYRGPAIFKTKWTIHDAIVDECLGPDPDKNELQFRIFVEYPDGKQERLALRDELFLPDPVTSPPTNGNGHHPADWKEAIDNVLPPEAAQAAKNAAEEAMKKQLGQVPGQKPQSVFKPFTLIDLMQLPPKEWLYFNLIGKGDIAALFGEAGTGKTFVGMDFILSGILGRQFAGLFNISKPFKVAYCAGEGVAGLKNRFAAAVNKYQVSPKDLGLTVYTDVPQLFDPNADKSIYVFVQELLDRGEQIDLLVIDTLHAANIGGDENSAKEISITLQAIKHARDKLGCTVLLLHHANKTGGYRGSSALHGAMDTMLQTKLTDGIGTLECFKQKDAERFKPLYFKLVGDHYAESAYVEWVEASTVKLNPDAPKKEQAKQDILELLETHSGLSQSQIVKNLSAMGRKTILAALKELEEEGMVEIGTGPNNSKIYQLGLVVP